MSAFDLRLGDSRDVLRDMAENSVDSCVCDPPYSLTSIVKRFGSKTAAPAQFGKDGAFARASAGFMGCTWDTGEVAFDPEFWAEVYRVLKPGAFLLAFSGTRTQHRMVCAIEDAGFEIRDQIGWAYGSGFPKSHDVSKGVDAALGETGTLGDFKTPSHNRTWSNKQHEGWQRQWKESDEAQNRYARQYVPATDSARQWQGWGTALKPAWEPICVARKPLIGTVAENVLEHGTGALNIDACRVPVSDADSRDVGREITRNVRPEDGWGMNADAPEHGVSVVKPEGRWPANLILSYQEDEFELRSDVTPEQRREVFGWLCENS